MAIRRELGDRHGEAASGYSLAHVLHRLGRHADAIVLYRGGVDLYGEHGDLYVLVRTLTRLADCYHAAGQPSQAAQARRQASAVLDELGQPELGRARALLERSP